MASAFFLSYNAYMKINELKEKYYSLEDSYKRYTLVQEYLTNHKDDEIVKEMLEVLTKRYGNARLSKAGRSLYACMFDDETDGR